MTLAVQLPQPNANDLIICRHSENNALHCLLHIKSVILYIIKAAYGNNTKLICSSYYNRQCLAGLTSKNLFLSSFPFGKQTPFKMFPLHKFLYKECHIFTPLRSLMPFFPTYFLGQLGAFNG